jgi:hypothetical protein
MLFESVGQSMRRDNEAEIPRLFDEPNNDRVPFRVARAVN